MINILVNGISTLEFIQFCIRRLVITEYHWNGKTGLITNHITILIPSYRSVRATHTRNFHIRIIRILIYALITETVYSSKWIIELDSGQIRTIFIIEVFIQAGQSRRIHLHDFVFVIGKRHVET